MDAMIMDCDQVFHVLTRGPFPSGAPEDPLVDEHLDHCLSCLRIAEALRPADDLGEETLAPSERRTLPSYRGGPMAHVMAGEAICTAASEQPPTSGASRWATTSAGQSVLWTAETAPAAATPHWTGVALTTGVLLLAGWLALGIGWTFH